MIHYFTKTVALGFWAVLLLPAVSKADAIFSNLGTSPIYDISEGNIVGNDFVGDNLAEGSTFTPLSPKTFASLSLALSCNLDSCPDAYTVSLNSDSGFDSPGTVIESFLGAGNSLGQLNVNNPLSVFNSVLMPSLSVGTQYWVVVSSDLNNSITWNFNSTGDSSDQAISTDGGATWFSPSSLTPGAYEVDGVATSATPEPGAFWLLSVGLSSFLLLRRSARA
jgi:hypothetical protein